MKPHQIDPISLVFGSVFFLLGGVFLVGGTTIPGSHVGRLWPIPLIVLGLIIALIAVRGLAKGGSSPDPGSH
jgi:hypothetical protein